MWNKHGFSSSDLCPDEKIIAESMKVGEKLCSIKKMPYLCTRKNEKGPVAQLNRVSDYGSEGYRFESCRRHLKIRRLQEIVIAFFYWWRTVFVEFWGIHVNRNVNQDVNRKMQ